MKSNILYREDGFLILQKEEVEFNILAEWFIRYLNDYVYVFDKDQVIGIISCKEFENCLRSGIKSIPLQEEFSFVDKESALDRIRIYKRFRNDITLFRLPVIDNGKIIGEYYDSLSFKENTERYHIKNIIPELSAFNQDISDYFKEKRIFDLAIITDSNDEYTMNIISTIKGIKPFFVDNYYSLIKEKESGVKIDAVLDVKYPDEYREYYINELKLTENVYIIFEIMSEILAKLFVKYSHDNGLRLIAVYAVGADDISYLGKNDEHTMSKNKTLNDVLNNQEYLKKFYINNEECYRYATDKSFGQLGGRVVRFNGLYNRLMDVESEYINVSCGIRKTEYNPAVYSNEIHFFGPCIVQGICVTDKYTIESYLQKIINQSFLNRFRVINHGSATHTPYGSFCNDFFNAMDTEFHEGDYIVFLDAFTENALRILADNGVPVISEKHVFDGLENLFLNNTYHCNHIANKIYAEMIYKRLNSEWVMLESDDCIREKKKVSSYFNLAKTNLDFRNDSFLNDTQLLNYCDKLKKMRISGSENLKIGSICTQANPFTKGHKALVEYAANMMDYVYIFVAQDSLSNIQFLERFKIVEEAVKEFDNIMVLSSGSSLSSYKIFPDYFSVAKKNVGFDLTNVWAETRIFAELFCPALGINYRILGEEPLDVYTNKLVEHLREVLPQYGIQIKIIPRVLSNNNDVISASRVRKMLSKKQYDSLEQYITPYAIETLKQYYEEILEDN